MDKEQRGELYDRIYDEFIKLIKGKIDKVVISEYELYELSKKSYWVDPNTYETLRNITYAEVLLELCKINNIEQTKDFVSNNYIFELENRKV